MAHFGGEAGSLGERWYTPGMKLWGSVGFLSALVVAFILCGCRHSGTVAGSRIKVKEGLDQDVAKVDLHPKATTVEDIAGVRMPRAASGNLEVDFQDRRVAPFETSTWTVDAHIRSVKLMPDRDYYMELEGKSGKETVVEVPDPDLCKGSPLEPQIAEARREIQERYHPTTTKKTLNDQATVTGVGFLGWRGRPTTGAHLMPGLGFKFN
jgi:hypothetical protein